MDNQWIVAINRCLMIDVEYWEVSLNGGAQKMDGL